MPTTKTNQTADMQADLSLFLDATTSKNIFSEVCPAKIEISLCICTV